MENSSFSEGNWDRCEGTGLAAPWALTLHLSPHPGVLPCSDKEHVCPEPRLPDYSLSPLKAMLQQLSPCCNLLP